MIKLLRHFICEQLLSLALWINPKDNIRLVLMIKNYMEETIKDLKNNKKL